MASLNSEIGRRMRDADESRNSQFRVIQATSEYQGLNIRRYEGTN